MKKMDYSETKDKIVSFIRSSVMDAGANGAVIGMSGGIDSTLTAYLSVAALGKKNVLGLVLPEKDISPQQDIDDALEAASTLGIEYRIIEISPVLSSFASVIPTYDTSARTANGNLKARTRMCILYYHANLTNRIVIGTGNKTEVLLGYFTKYGDGGVDIEPIGSLYKTQVRELAEHIGIPSKMIEKTPTAGLWPGQTDETELGFSYETADQILELLVDKKKEISKIKMQYLPEVVDRLTARLASSAHKRICPPVIEI